jgi:quinohemoprotein ethanol dehydrogenase
VPLPNNWNPGTMTTASNLVFQGRADGVFVAYDAENGKELWSVNLGLGISAPPVTYTIDGEQRIALLVGWGGSGPNISGSMAAQYGWAYKAQPRRVISFALGANQPLPPTPPQVFPKAIDVAGLEIDEAQAVAGNALYGETCGSPGAPHPTFARLRLPPTGGPSPTSSRTAACPWGCPATPSSATARSRACFTTSVARPVRV